MNINKRHSRYKRLVMTLFPLILLGIIYFHVVPGLVNIPKYKPTIEREVNNRLKAKVYLGNLNLSMSWMLGAVVSTDSIKIVHPDGSKFINTKGGSIEVSLLDLLRKHVIIRDISLHDVDADIVRNSKGELNISELIPAKVTTPKVFKIDLDDTNIFLNHYKVHYTDNFVKPNLSYLLKGNEIKVTDFTLNKRFNIFAHSIFTLNKGIPVTLLIDLNADLKKKKIFLNMLNIKSKNINVDATGKVRKYDKNPDVDGEIFVYNTRIRNVADIIPPFIKIPNDIVKKIYKYNVDGRANGSVRIKGKLPKPGVSGQILVNDISLVGYKSQDIDATVNVGFDDKKLLLDIGANVGLLGKVAVNGYFKPFSDKTMSLDIYSNVLNLKQAHKMLLAIRDIFAFKLGPLPDMKVDGNGKVFLKIRGKTKKPSLYGYVNIYNGKGLYNKLADEATDVNGRILFTGNKVVYDNLRANVKGNPVKVKGYNTIDLNSYADVDISLPKIDLTEGKSFIDRSFLLKKVAYGLRKVKGIAGNGKTFVHLKGTQYNLLTEGYIDVTNAKAFYEGFSKPLDRVNGRISFKNEKVKFEDVKGYLESTPATVNGYIDDNKYIEMTIVSNSINLAEIRQLFKDSPALDEVESGIKDINSATGTASGVMHFAGNPNKDFFKDLDANVSNGTLTYKNISAPVRNINGNLFITLNDIKFNSVKGNIYDSAFVLNGKVADIQADVFKPYLVADIKNFPAAKLYDLSKVEGVPPSFAKSLADITNLKGRINGIINLNNKDIYGNLYLNNLSATYRPLNIPIKIHNAKIISDGRKFEFSNLAAEISSSKFKGSGSYNLDSKIKPIILNASADIAAADINKYLNPALEQPIRVSGILPLKAKFAGGQNDFNLESNLILGKKGNVDYLKEIGLTDEENRYLNVNVKRRNNILFANVNVDDDTAKQYLTIKGKIIKNPENENVLKDFNILIPEPISIKLLNPVQANKKIFSSGTFTADILLNGVIDEPKVTGDAYINNAVLSQLGLNIPSSEIKFTPEDIYVTNTAVNWGDSKANVDAVIANVLDFPFIVKTVKINADSLNLDTIAEKISQAQKEQNENTDSNLKPAADFTPSVDSAEPASESNNPDITETTAPFVNELPPVVINEGFLLSNEVIARNLIMNNLDANFNLSPDWLFTVSGIKFKIINGDAEGKLLVNIKDSSISGDFSAKGIEANAAATTLFNTPNELYGNTSGRVIFSTHGTTDVDLFKNADGTATFMVQNGRLVRLGSLEYLLRAVNVFQSGVAGLNVNNVIDLVAPQKTGNFKTLQGTLTVKDGILHTENVTSQGSNLSLALAGSIDMATNVADITITGRLSKKVSGLLGPIGSLSINQFIEFIPGIGFMPTSTGIAPRSGILYRIPGLSRIPLLGLGDRKDYREFKVDVEGDMYDQKSYKNFRWVN